MKVLVTGSNGFIGKNLCSVLRRREDVELLVYDLDKRPDDLESALEIADVVFHLAGVNRPKDTDEFETGNAGSVDDVCKKLRTIGRAPKIVLSSSIQAELDNPYGVSKRNAEEVLRGFAEETVAGCVVYRFKNLFGKWCRPNYNSVTATFCHNIAHDLPIQISDPKKEMDLTYIDDVVEALVGELEGVKETGFRFGRELPSYRVSLGELAGLIQSFRDSRDNLMMPNFSKAIVRNLYASYLSYLDKEDFAYELIQHKDERGELAELLKSPYVGQIFVSRTRPGITRGNHYHDSKVEKFAVVEGEAIIRFRSIKPEVRDQRPEVREVLEYRVSGSEFRVVDIPPGYAHSIENVGKGDMVVLFWASEMFNPEKPDTYFELVKNTPQRAQRAQSGA